MDCGGCLLCVEIVNIVGLLAAACCRGKDLRKWHDMQNEWVEIMRKRLAGKRKTH